MRNVTARALLLAPLWLVSAFPAQAQGEAWPTKPVRIIVPFGAGGATDNIARQLSVKLSEELGQQVVIENKTGAAGNIAVDFVAKAVPDGYTVLMGNNSTNAINPWLYGKRMQSQPLKDLVPVTMVAAVPSIFGSSAKFVPNNLAELAAYAKAHPGEVNHASSGAGSYAMIDMMDFERAAGLKMVHVPYKAGPSEYVPAMVGNQIQISFTNASSVLELTRAGKLKALAVTGDNRLPELPNVPTMAEAGFKGIGNSSWQGLFVPVGTPSAIVTKLHAAVNKALVQDELRETYAKMIITPLGSASPGDFAAFVDRDAKLWKKRIEDLKITVD
jgi:tripartite-type tricarboxylate transporter receptor subunit TctC